MNLWLNLSLISTKGKLQLRGNKQEEGRVLSGPTDRDDVKHFKPNSWLPVNDSLHDHLKFEEQEFREMRR